MKHAVMPGKLPESRGFSGRMETAPTSACNTRQGLTPRIDFTDWRATAMVPKTCSIPECERPFLARGYCRNHYQQARAAGRLPKRTPEERFWAKVNKTPGCWEWTATLNVHGYGAFFLVKAGRQAHRVSWEMANGPIPDGQTIDHICHNRKCVNPGHLRLATRKQNCENLTGAYANSRSGVRGVHWHKHKGKWVALIQHNGKNVTVGYFDDIADADRAATARRLELFTHNDADRGVNAQEVRMKSNV